MDKGFFTRQSPWIQIILLALVTVFTFLLVTLITIIGAIQIFHIGLGDLTSIDPANPDNTALLKFLQIGQSIGIFVIPPLVLARLASKKPFEYLGLKGPLNSRPVIILFVLILAMLPVVSYTGMLNEGMQFPKFLSGLEDWMQRLEDQGTVITEAFLSVDSLAGFLLNLLMIAIIPAIGEEFFFRGILQKVFSEWFKNIHVAVILTAFLFSALHFQFYGFLPRFLLGILFGYLFVWTKNLWYPVLGHFFHNAIPVSTYYLYNKGIIADPMETIGEPSMAWLWAIVGAGFAWLIITRFRVIFDTDSKFL